MGRDIADVEMYDVRHNCWRPCTPMRTPRSAHAAVAVGGHVFALGGQRGPSAVDSCEWFDPQGGVGWQAMAGSLHVVRKYAAAAVLAGGWGWVGGCGWVGVEVDDG